MAVSDFVTLACVPNRVDDFTVTSGSDASSDLAAANVQSDIISKVWRNGFLTSRHSWLQSTFVAGGDADLQAAYFISNLSATGLFRVRSHTTTISSLWERMAPTSVESSTNATRNSGSGAPLASEVNEDCDTPGSTGTRLTLGLVGIVEYGFGTPVLVPATGSAVNEFRIVLRKQAAGTLDKVTVKVLESGSTRSASWFVDPSQISETNAEFVFHWDASILSTAADGSVVEMYISQGDGGDVDLLIECVEWNSYGTGAGSASLDSGILSAFETFSDQQFGSTTIDRFRHKVNWIAGFVFPSEITSAAFLILEMWDFNASQRYQDSISIPGSYFDTNWGPTEVGRLLSGPIFVPTTNAKAVNVSVNQYGKRTMDVQFQLLTRSETLQNLYLWGSLDAGVAQLVVRTESGSTFVRGRGGPFCVVIPQPNETGVQTLQNCLCRISSQPKYQDMGIINGASTTSVTLPLEEW